VLIAFWALSGRGAVALDVGTVVETSGTADIERGSAWNAAVLNQAIAVGDSLRTGAPGAANLAFFDRSISAPVEGAESAALVSALAVQERSLVTLEKYEFDPRGPDAQFKLVRGRALATVGKTRAGYAIETPTAIALANGTTFVVSYDEGAGSTAVVGVDGRVRVTGLNQEVWIGAQEITTVAKGRPPTPPRRLDEQEFRQYLDGFQFIAGGRPESLALRGPLTNGTKVPEPERLVTGSVPHPDVFDACPRTSAPTCATGEPFSGVGGVDIEF
jgi:hypothetical protein